MGTPNANNELCLSYHVHGAPSCSAARPQLCVRFVVPSSSSSSDDDDSSTKTGNYGVDDDDTDNSDVAGRIAHNKSNNLRELIDRKLRRAQKLCPYWPRRDYAQCTEDIVRCLLVRMSEEGELSDHLDLRGGDDCDGDFDSANDDAEGQSRDIFLEALKLERSAKRECHNDDDACKDNVECQFLADLAAKYPTVVRLVDCPQIDLENWDSFETANDDDDDHGDKHDNNSGDDDDDESS